MLVPAAQEIGAFECDTGQEADILRSQAPEWIRDAVPGYAIEHLNMDLIHEGWNRKVCHSSWLVGLPSLARR